MIFESYMAFLQKIMLFSSYVKNNSSFEKPLTSKEENMYLQKYKDGDMEAYKILIEHNLRLVAHIVKKYNGTDEADDLISVGSMGLIKAIKTFQLNHGTQFSTYAAKCIENEILMLLRVNKKHKNTISIEDALGTDSEDNELAVIDVMFESDDVEQRVHNSVVSEKLNAKLKKYLTKREYIIICLRYGLNGCPALTQREVASKLKISRSYISRLEKKALETMRDNIDKKEYT
ncbi:MAG: RNA polymerase sporulation sigma factor SigK [Firmicutes bacterium]|nr:RNA polymerase sporulation sigma factor SigK [Bacillota bacterium]MDY5041878.1 RNA polymerase sporulation sigma factor SigK [Eubacteriales bacterium]